MPMSWCEALIVPVYTSGDKQSCNNYRGINLFNTLTNIFEQIMTNRLQEKLEHKFEESLEKEKIFTIKTIAEKNYTYSNEK